MTERMNQFRFDSNMIRLTGLCINTIASIVMTVHVIVLHEKLQVSRTGETIVVLNDREHAERIMMYVVVGLYMISFVLYIWSAFLEQSNRRKEMYLLEKYFGVNFTDISGVSFDEVEDFEYEKQQGFSVRKAKDIKRKSPYEIHKNHTYTIE